MALAAPLALALTVAAQATSAHAAAPAVAPATLRTQLAQVVKVHEGTVLALATARSTRKTLAELAGSGPGQLDLAVRALAPGADPQRAAMAALADTGLSCAAVVNTRSAAPIMLIGDCRQAASKELAPTVERVSAGGRGENVESDTTLSASPALLSGAVQDLALEHRSSRRSSVAFSVTRAATTGAAPELQELPEAELLTVAMQLRRYWLGDFDTGLYGLAQLAGMHAEGEVAQLTSGLAKAGTSPSLGAGVGFKLTLPGGLSADVHGGLSTQTLAPVAPLAAARLGWSW